MEFVRLRARTSADSRLLLVLPSFMGDSEVDVTVALMTARTDVVLDDCGWPAGFRQRFLGAYPEAPEEPSELELRDPDF